MGTPLLSEPKPDGQTFDEIVRRTPLLFRLHSGHSQTLFHREGNVLVASLHHQGLKYSSSKELSLRLMELEKNPSSSTPEETREAIKRHITSWKDKNYEPSSHISLTFNVLYVFWEWKQRMSRRQHKNLQNDFTIIVLNGSKLHASASRKAKLGTEWLPKDSEEFKVAYRFAESHEEVIVDKFIPSAAILGFMRMSELVEFMPPQCQNLLENKSTFQKSLPPEMDKFNCAVAHKSLRFALALLAPMLVPGEQQRTDIERAETDCKAVGHPSPEGVTPKISPRSDHEAVSEQRVAEDGKSLESWRKQSHSPEIKSRSVDTIGDSPRQEPLAKRRHLSEEGQSPDRIENESAVESADAVKEGQASVEPLKWESEYVGILATGVCRVKDGGRKECQIFCTLHGRELLKQYKNAIQRDPDLGKEPLKTMRKIMDGYKAWDRIGTS